MDIHYHLTIFPNLIHYAIPYTLEYQSQSVQFFLETFGKWQFFTTLAGIKSKNATSSKMIHLLKTYLAEVAIRAEVAKKCKAASKSIGRECIK